jgi:protein-S-isoprenylcysteine O-methyltransferase Ste14
MNSDFFKVAVGAGLWCFLHSLLISHQALKLLEHTPRFCQASWRLAYNLFSLVTLGCLWWYWSRLPAEPLFNWPGWWQLLRWTGLAAAGYLFWQGIKTYDNLAFLGLRQLGWRSEDQPYPESDLIQHGILAHIRHPYYTGGILVVIFCQPVTDINIIYRGVFVAYFIIGAYLEERKLLAELGEVYRRYQNEVPMFLPRLVRRRRRDS